MAPIGMGSSSLSDERWTLWPLALIGSFLASALLIVICVCGKSKKEDEAKMEAKEEVKQEAIQPLQSPKKDQTSVKEQTSLSERSKRAEEPPVVYEFKLKLRKSQIGKSQRSTRSTDSGKAANASIKSGSKSGAEACCKTKKSPSGSVPFVVKQQQQQPSAAAAGPISPRAVPPPVARSVQAPAKRAPPSTPPSLSGGLDPPPVFPGQFDSDKDELKGDKRTNDDFMLKGDGNNILDGSASSTISPRGLAQKKTEAPRLKLKMEHVRSDDPAYRSLADLDDAFGQSTPDGGLGRSLGTARSRKTLRASKRSLYNKTAKSTSTPPKKKNPKRKKDKEIGM